MKGGGVHAFRSFSTLKKLGRTFNFKSNKPRVKLIKTLYVPVHNLQHFSSKSRGLRKLQILVILSLNSFEQNSYLKILFGFIWRIKGLEGGC